MKDLIIERHHENRPWGGFDRYIHNDLFTLKIITVNPGQSTSLQFHHDRQEYWVVISGSGIVDIGEEKYNVEKNSAYVVPKETIHRIAAGLQPLVVVEVSTGRFDEQDIVRIEDRYGRI